ncbi:KTSC domain-containing protein [Polaribacter litorisediminis]|uniref:KTSC domain-containing protein n=1 Tax=Polaribacter litorisediminis TaxID=1908341 RepID=UPI001CBD3023|nr:KTSC domain-containing protein [Polaribacter litorisediminis]UAM96710.1 KTSC domain-containing protein [Polaribacter litorisediminis]
MKRIKEYKKLFQVEGKIDLKELKTSYRSLVKEWHPDKFQDEEKKAEAENVSTRIIDGYHFLVSIAPETKEANLEAYKTTITEFQVADWHHKSMLLEVTFTDGNTYEYFGVSKILFGKFVNAKSMNNFGKRNIFNSFLYRKSKKASVMA